MSVARRDAGLAAPAGYWANVGWWSLRLGERDEARSAFARSLEWYVRWMHHLATAGSPFRLRAADWRVVLERSILVGDDTAMSAVLAQDIDLGDGSLTAYGRAWTASLVALVLRDDRASLDEATRLELVPRRTLKREKSYPRLGEAVRHLVAGDEVGLAQDLDAICEAHVATAKRGFRRHSETALVCMPATVLATLARRRGLRSDVDDRFHRVALEYWRCGDPDLPASAAGLFEAEYDLVPQALIER